jgi:hypothetical protein
MRLCKKIIIDLTDETLTCRLENGDYYNLQGPSVIDYKKIGQDKIKVTAITYYYNNSFMNKSGASGIYLAFSAALARYVIHSAYWDSKNKTVHKRYNMLDGSIRSIEHTNRITFDYKIKEFERGALYDNITKQYNDKIPVIKELFNLAGKDYEIEPCQPYPPF